MEIYELLKKDHKEVKSLFHKIEDALEEEDFDEVESLFSEVRDQLTAHSKAEAEVFYQPLKMIAEEEGEELAWEGEEEHHVVALVLNELSRISVDEEPWKAKFTVLTELVNHHVQEEEGEIFKAAKRYFSSDDAEEMAENMESLKQTYLGMVDSALDEDIALLLNTVSQVSHTQNSRHA
ncbi:hemerythrin domain-containing protein [Bdellovibrio sp. HCB-162]|uniref:hemerythrin domain-containing protein n=1 Tax=Bdellovibrio sp. HCB-162 TaxID=3394234 RepID=UPI0039BCAFBD